MQRKEKRAGDDGRRDKEGKVGTMKVEECVEEEIMGGEVGGGERMKRLNGGRKGKGKKVLDKRIVVVVRTRYSRVQ